MPAPPMDSRNEEFAEHRKRYQRKPSHLDFGRLQVSLRSTSPASGRGKKLKLFAGGGSFGLWGFFIEFAAGHAFAGGVDFFFAEEFGVRGIAVYRSRRRRLGVRGCGFRRIFGGEQIFQSVGGGFGKHCFFGGGGDAHVGAERFAREGFEFFQAGEFLQIAETETHQKFLGGSVENRAAHDFFAAGSGDQALVEQRGENAGRVDAANFGNFRTGDGLLVGDDRESFKSGHGEAQRWAKALDEAAHDVVMLRLGVHLVAAGNGADLDAAFFDGVADDQFVERSLHGDFFFTEGGSELIDGGGLVGGVNDGFEGGFAFFVGHGSSLPSKFDS